MGALILRARISGVGSSPLWTLSAIYRAELYPRWRCDARVDLKCSETRLFFSVASSNRVPLLARMRSLARTGGGPQLCPGQLLLFFTQGLLAAPSTLQRYTLRVRRKTFRRASTLGDLRRARRLKRVQDTDHTREVSGSRRVGESRRRRNAGPCREGWGQGGRGGGDRGRCTKTTPNVIELN